MRSQYKQKFYELYIKEILPLFMDYEPKRRRLLFTFISSTVIFSVVLLFNFYNIVVNKIFCNSTQPEVIIMTIITTIISIIILFIVSGMNKKFKKELKSACEPIFKKCFHELVWDKCENFDNDILIKSNLFSSFNREYYDDIFTITHKGVNVKVVEVHLQDVQGSGKSRRVYDVFKGVVIVLPSNKTVKAQTVVTTKGDRNVNNTITGLYVTLISVLLLVISSIVVRDIFNFILYGVVFIGIIAYYLIIKRKNKFQGVKLEDVEFDRKFQVISEDQLEARYLVTPAFMDRLKGLQTAFGTQKVKCSFFENKIMFAISTNKDLFEVGSLFASLDKSRQVNNFFNELTSILNLVDHFKLDQSIGL